ncbi:ATP-dependent RNA helicase DeaD [Streptomyces tendae]
MITLTKEGGPADLDGVTHLSIGVSWDPTAGSSGGVLGKLRRKTGTDLDLIAVALQGGDPVRLAGLDSLDPMGNGSLLHSGDNQTGHGDGDDETVTVEFARLPDVITSIVFVAAAYKKGSSFQKARNISFRRRSPPRPLGRPPQNSGRRPAAAPQGGEFALPKTITPALPAVETFAELDLPARMLSALGDQGVSVPFPIQAATLPNSLAGRDVLGRGRTGSGRRRLRSGPAGPHGRQARRAAATARPGPRPHP